MALLVQNVQNGPSLLTNGVTGSGLIVASQPAHAGSGNVESTAPLFESDWSTATGLTTNALGDGGKWSYVQLDDDHEIVSAAGLGFPAGMTNVYRVMQGENAEGFSRHVGIQNGWPEPQVGESLYFRWYDSLGSFGTTTAESNNWHCPQNALPAWGLSGWAFFPRMTSTGYHCRWELGTGDEWRMMSTISTPNPVPKDDVYRIEYRFHREATSTWRFEMRWYDSSNVLVRDETDLWNGDHSIQFSSSVNVFSAVTLQTDSLRGLLLGSNGGPDLAGLGYRYFGGVMVRSDDWCGAY